MQANNKIAHCCKKIVNRYFAHKQIYKTPSNQRGNITINVKSPTASIKSTLVVKMHINKSTYQICNIMLIDS